MMGRDLPRRFLSRVFRLTLAGSRRGVHVTRYAMYARLAEVFRRRGRTGGRVLAVSHSARLWAALDPGGSEVVEGHYPDCDLLSLPFGAEQFDYLVSDQVIQHIAGSPQQVFDESRRVLKPGGWVVHTTSCVNPIVRAPGDYWRFTPDGLRLLCRGFSEVVEAGGWGNPHIVWVDWLGLRYEGVPAWRWHPLHRVATANRSDWPVTTWVIAQK
jgi:SAM-dependent methyltransferase